MARAPELTAQGALRATVLYCTYRPQQPEVHWQWRIQGPTSGFASVIYGSGTVRFGPSSGGPQWNGADLYPTTDCPDSQASETQPRFFKDEQVESDDASEGLRGEKSGVGQRWMRGRGRSEDIGHWDIQQAVATWIAPAGSAVSLDQWAVSELDQRPSVDALTDFWLCTKTQWLSRSPGREGEVGWGPALSELSRGQSNHCGPLLPHRGQVHYDRAGTLRCCLSQSKASSWYQGKHQESHSKASSYISPCRDVLTYRLSDGPLSPTHPTPSPMSPPSHVCAR